MTRARRLFHLPPPASMSRILILVALVAVCVPAVHAQRAPRLGWYLAPNARAMFLPGHVGRAVGVEGGAVIAGRVKVGVATYGRSGPVNPETFPTALPAGQTYRGQSVLDLRADHGYVGAVVAPLFAVAGGVTVEVPISVGFVIAGFYLAGDDRETPDGRRVSAWENELFDGGDVGAGLAAEGGVRASVALRPGVRLTGGVLYTRLSGWETYARPSDFYDGLSTQVGVSFGTR